jgi:two-component system LytT family response regulator
MVVKKGGDFVAMKVEQIAYFYSEHKITFLVDREGKRYIVDKTLAEIESETDPKQFFRLNRKFFAHVDAIKKFRPAEKGKLVIDLFPAVAEEVTVSQENSAPFKEWIGR